MTQMPTLAELVGQVILAGLAGPRDPLQQIGEAERLAGELSHLGESLIGFFVEQARADGLSWAEIGAPRGLSRQGAQQRYTPFLVRLTLADLVEAGVLRQFGEAALAGLRRAEGHAARLGHDTIDSGDVLLGLLDDDGGLVAAAIRALGADPVLLRAEVDGEPDSDAPAGGPAAGPVLFGPEARRALDGAIGEARGHQVGPTHLLLGLLRNPAGRAGRVLGACGITRSTAMASVVAVANRQSTERA